MPADPQGAHYQPDALRQFAEAAFQAVGVPGPDAAITVDNLIEANLRGVDTHGITRVLVPYLRRIQHGMMSPTTEIRVVRERPSTALLDGQNGIGQVIASHAMQLAIEKASVTGSAWVNVCHSNHFGAAAYYAEMAVRHDMVAVIATNGPAAVAPWGGRQPILATNPLAFAVPAGNEPPVILDMATTVVSRGRINLFAKQNLEIPSGWALDEEGNPTNNPHAALRGTLLPMGGYKGYGLSLIVDLLAGVMGGANYGMHFPGHLAEYDRPPHNVGSLFAAVSVDSFMDVDQFKERVDVALREIKDSPRAPEIDRIYAPGEIEYETRQRRLHEGIPLPAEVISDFRSLAAELGIAFPDASEDGSACS
jgi:LDH2 family malate/lactate/ureidoglycolate dehydrogenase